MILLKEKVKDRGYVITVVIGNKKYNSYWSSPPIYRVSNHSCNFEVEYLKGRYPILNTKLKAKQFSSLYKNLWIEVTPYQLYLMKHCIGIGKNKKPYRNRFFTQENDSDWHELVEKGLAKKSTEEPKGNKLNLFWLTKQGVEFVLGKSISDKVYYEL